MYGEHWGTKEEMAELTLLTVLYKHLIQGKLFFCNPDKNKECKKSSCYRNGGDCMVTKREECRW